jgi:hypothetical protein
MSAAEHRQMADQERQQAEEHGGEVRGNTDVPVITPSDPGSGFIYGTDTYDPAARHRAQAGRHEQLAAEHEAAAEALESFENAECAQFPPATRASCPLIGSIASVRDVDGGVEITLAEDANAPAILAHIRCHLAYAATRGREGMESCPLYIRGVPVAAGDSERTIVLSVADASLLSELRLHTRAHLTAAP